MGLAIDKFANEMAVLMPRFHRELLRKQSSLLTAGEISFAQIAILHILKERGTCNMTEIAKMFSVTTSAATGIVNRMVSSGLLKRVFDSRDRRVINVEPTLKGKKLINGFLRQRKKMMINLFKKISSKERESYLNTVKKIYALLVEDK